MEATGDANRFSNIKRQCAVPIGFELWERLRRIDRAGAEIVLCRTSPKIENKSLRAVSRKASGGKSEDAPPASPAPRASPAPGTTGDTSAPEWARDSRVWVVTIRWYVPPYQFEMVQHIHPTLAEALTLAVQEAEGRGWAR
jgi:hypothetical protein